MELLRCEAGEAEGAEAADEAVELGLELDARLRVEEVEGDGGTPAADPQEEVLRRAGPRRREHLQHVALGGGGFVSVVGLVVGDDAVYEWTEAALFLFFGAFMILVFEVRGGGGRAEGLEVLVVLLEPMLLESFGEDLGVDWGTGRDAVVAGGAGEIAAGEGAGRHFS